MLKILVTGSNGLLGQKLIYAMLRANSEAEGTYNIIATSRGVNRLSVQDGYRYFTMDASDKAEVHKVINAVKPECIIHTAAMTNVDECELNQSACYAANVEAVQILLDELQILSESNPDQKPHFIYISTDFVFDGESGPYTENDTANPVSYYGWSKLEAEKRVQQSGLPFSIIRTIIVFGITDNMSRSNLVLWTKTNLEQHKSINVINDQYRAPTLAEDLADACLKVAEKKARGIFHIAGKDTHCILDLVNMVADFYELDKKYIQPVSSKTLNQPAKRPPKTGFILDKAIRELQYVPRSFTDGIRFLDEQLKRQPQK